MNARCTLRAKNLILLAFFAVVASACTNTTTPVLSGVLGGRSLALACAAPGGVTADSCGSTAVRALVGGGSRGTISLGIPGTPAWADLDVSVPGYTPLRVPGIPTALVTDTGTPFAYAAVALAQERQVIRIDLGKLGSNQISFKDAATLSFEPTDLAIVVRDGARWLVVTDPDGGKVWTTPVADFGPTAQWTPWPVGGSPSSLLWLPGRKQLWIGHLHHAFASVIDPATGSLVGDPVSLDDACRDGLDNDGDGLIDRADRGCDGPGDDSELDPEVGNTLCGNGKDDDGDGKTDADDAGCKGLALPTGLGIADGCRDGKDNDGDGKTDAADPDCSAGSEWPNVAGVEQLPAAPHGACDNGQDDDGDGLADLADPDCFNRASGSETGTDRAPALRMAATLDEGYVACSHQGRREVLFVDAAKRQLVVPKRGDTAQFLRTSRLDERDGVLGLALGAPATALAPAQFAGKSAIAIATTPGGLVTAELGTNTTLAGPSVQLTPAATQGATSVARPALLVGGTTVDLGASVPTRYASMGPLRTEVSATGTNYFGVLPSTDPAEHRTEQWRLTYQGEVPGTASATGAWRGPRLLHDPQADFCARGVVAGDLVILAPSGLAGCPTKPVRVAISAVYGDTLEVEPASAAEDLFVALDGQYAIDLAATPTWTTAVPLPAPGCFADGAVAYTIRAADWLLRGSRSGLLSSRDTLDGLCAGLPATELNGARVREPTLKIGSDGKALRPSACPYANGVLDANFNPATTTSTVFAAIQIVPGCRNTTLASGQSAVQVLPSLRGMTWVFNMAAGFQPRRIAVGSAPTTIQTLRTLPNAYVVDGGSGALYTVDLSAGTVSSTLQ